MPNQRLIALNANNGTQVVVVATRFSSRVEIMEDESGVPQGLIYQVPDDGFAATYQVGPATEPLILGNPTPHAGGSASPLLGLPAQGSTGSGNQQNATNLFKATSATANATKIRVRELE